MENSKGALISIEGSDKSLVSRQVKLLASSLRSQGYQVAVKDYPQNKDASYFSNKYLSGKYGDIHKLNPYTSSLLFLLELFDDRDNSLREIDDGKVILCSGFVGEIMAFQGSKFANPEERRGFYIWIDNLVFQILGLQRPNRTIVISQSDQNHSQNFNELCQLFPKDFTSLESVRSGKVLDSSEIALQLQRLVEPLLPTDIDTKSKAKPINIFVPESLNEAQKSIYLAGTKQLVDNYNRVLDELNKQMDSDKAHKLCRSMLPIASLNKPIKTAAASYSDTVEQLINGNLSNDLTTIKLSSRKPLNETDLVAEIVYSASNQPLSLLREEVSNWSYEAKQEVLKGAGESKHKIIEKITYSWDILSSYEAFTEFRRNFPELSTLRQDLTPRYGYSVPKDIEDAGVSEQYESSFDLSLDLYSQLQASGAQQQAQYLTLLGHKLRWQVDINLQQLSLVDRSRRHNHTSQEVKEIVDEMCNKAREVHPIITDGLILLISGV